MGTNVCYCGLIKQGKAGTTTRDGVEYCNRCGLLTEPPSPSIKLLQPVSSTHVTTLATLPGFRITKVFGLVSEVGATSGFTASTKGTNALSITTEQLRRSATAMGANAIVGLQGSPFGAGGGITSAFGGDAVGVLLMGTAVWVEPEPNTEANSL